MLANSSLCWEITKTLTGIHNRSKYDTRLFKNMTSQKNSRVLIKENTTESEIKTCNKHSFNNEKPPLF